ncbi:MAG: hypothetical protein H7320_15405 [Ferruginibacter sp.]|nr:hypothetical protein [Ferruginibacter sp.]
MLTLRVFRGSIFSFLLFFFTNNCSAGLNNNKNFIKISVDRNSVDMGRSIPLKVHFDRATSVSKDVVFLVYVNQKRWGAQEQPDQNGNRTFILPLPNPGIVEIQVVAVNAEPNNWMGISDRNLLMVGRLIPKQGLFSNVVNVHVLRRKMPKLPDDGHIFCMQWEPWFSTTSWGTAQAVPVLGFYESFNEDIIRQHLLWMIDLGVNAIMPDWSNHMWGAQHWDERGEGARVIISNTNTLLEVLAKMRDEGIDVPKLIFFPGLSNGKPTTTSAFNEQITWIYQNFILNPRFVGLFQIYENKPLLVILDTGVIGNKDGTTASAFIIPFFKSTLELPADELDKFRKVQVPLDDTHFTLRFMSSQNQLTKHNELGYWSWMDGQIDPIITYKNSKAEAVTVTPSFFEKFGWLAPEAYGRRGGATYLQSFSTAIKFKPKVIFLHQFNEFTGQSVGQGYGERKDIFLDSYSVELSDDLEPVSMTAKGYRGDVGGWGFYYLNLTRALMKMFRENDVQSTIIAINSPLQNMVIPKANILLQWTLIGPKPKGYLIKIDGNKIVDNLKKTSYQLDLSAISKGKHLLTVEAVGVQTKYPLLHSNLDTVLKIPVNSKALVDIIIK